MAAMAAGPDMVAGGGVPGYSCSSFTSGFVFAQVPSVQTDGHVRRREVDQRRRFLGLAESLVSLEQTDSARLSLLVAAVADSLCLVGGQKPGMVQTFFGRVLSRSGNHRPVFYLGATTPAVDGCGINNLPSNHNRPDRQLLLLQSTDDRVVLVAD